ncbi:Stk1 family PASTA domain-containing Ser/Thr kinase [Clostridium gasigenes]|uniref:Stk1 family PASTA domain-containing Ser/Thr kinase n=1 Tax=Clostridium gasigenes TaxID=94869 RepID=UPI0014383438|nr:Stk1 family PASTA domain-containing Ser/Thr kinase [Clostridium gasigenes]NKF05997.1 Stk1 family PASTA domain-containing Ser/Thr kinase [Clostridium gasigenes]QSW19280.1 Stk1 family PASTA domain-containing Ser/Thr kinase [Clostridium gasigenes]
MKGIVLGNRYELLEKIGEGGMAEVYKARCNKLNRFVAVKILRKQFANNEEISQKFKKEATAIANLSDANIVNILDVGTQDDIDYIVMELVNGKTLKDVINFNGNLGYATAIKIGLQIAKALDCAHKNNIIHRDIKPQNILITENGDVKVTDFGIAKSTDSSTITNTTSIIGSAHYLSPEQAKGTYIDCRADIYSLGIVLYEMVTGKLPFEGDSPVTVALKHLQEEPVAPKNINSAIPDSLNKLILKAMEKEAVKRYQSAKDIIQDLQKIQQNPDIIISDKPIQDNQYTIVMSPVSLDTNKKNNMSKLEEDYYEDEDEDEAYEDEEDEEEDDDYEEKKVKKKKKGSNVAKKIIIAIVGVLILVGLVATGLKIATGVTKVKDVKVPEISGKTVEEAKVILEKVKLEVEEVGSKKSDKPEGAIVEIDPKVGTVVKEKTKVKVMVSAGIEKLKMIDLREVEFNEAIKRLKDMGITNVKKTEEFSESIPYGLVISQDPKLKTEVTEDTAVNLVVSRGAEKKLVDVPNVIKKSASDAKSKLEGLKLSVEIKEKDTDRENENGIVLEQSISDKKVEAGTAITISVGKYVKPIVLINLDELGITGKKVSEARSILEGKGLKVVFANGGVDEANDIVSGYNPAKAEAGATITLSTEKPKQEKPKPDNPNKQDNPNKPTQP